MAEDMLKLKSSQGEIFEVEPELAGMSTLIKNMMDESGTDEEIPLPNVKTAILSKVIDYCKYHKDSPAEKIQKPLKSANLVECGVSEWDSEFVSIEQEMLFELILAANYLDIKSLLDLTCAKVASMIKGKTAEEVRKQFKIENPADTKILARERLYQIYAKFFGLDTWDPKLGVTKKAGRGGRAHRGPRGKVAEACACKINDHLLSKLKCGASPQRRLAKLMEHQHATSGRRTSGARTPDEHRVKKTTAGNTEDRTYGEESRTRRTLYDTVSSSISRGVQPGEGEEGEVFPSTSVFPSFQPR